MVEPVLRINAGPYPLSSLNWSPHTPGLLASTDSYTKTAKLWNLELTIFESPTNQQDSYSSSPSMENLFEQHTGRVLINSRTIPVNVADSTICDFAWMNGPAKLLSDKFIVSVDDGIILSSIPDIPNISISPNLELACVVDADVVIVKPAAAQENLMISKLKIVNKALLAAKSESMIELAKAGYCMDVHFQLT